MNTRLIGTTLLAGAALWTRGACAESPCSFPTTKALGHEVPKFSLRKTSDGSKNEAEPALLGYENPDSGKDYKLWDLALKWDVLECKIGATGRFTLSPLFEAHRSTASDNEIKKTSAKVKMETWWGILRGNKDDRSDGSAWRPIVSLEYAETHDAVNHKNSSSYDLSVRAISALPYWPGGELVWDCRTATPSDVSPSAQARGRRSLDRATPSLQLGTCMAPILCRLRRSSRRNRFIKNARGPVCGMELALVAREGAQARARAWRQSSMLQRQISRKRLNSRTTTTWRV